MTSKAENINSSFTEGITSAAEEQEKCKRETAQTDTERQKSWLKRRGQRKWR